MKFSEHIKPISYVKAHAAQIIRDLSDHLSGQRPKGPYSRRIGWPTLPARTP